MSFKSVLDSQDYFVYRGKIFFMTMTCILYTYLNWDITNVFQNLSYEHFLTCNSDSLFTDCLFRFDKAN
jgi:hypothetical protein